MLSNLEIKAHHIIKCLQKRPFYDSRTRYDTIFAPVTTVQTARGSPLGVIRLSGDKTEDVINQLTKKKVLRKLPLLPNKIDKNTINPRCATITRISNPSTNELLDRGLVLWFPRPHSYTGEDVCELHLHGSQAIMSKTLSVLGTISGLRPAEPGEFTRRSVMNNKISLLQAESLCDLIASKTDNQRRLALRGYDKSTQFKYLSWREELVSILAHLEASIDFGEDELIGEKKVVNECIDKIHHLSLEISHFIESSSRCRDIIQDGVKVAILGKPNAGKSTIMNLLCRRNKSIVSNLSGTTRDVVEHSFELGGHQINLFDTAGLKGLDTFNNDPDNELLKQHAVIEREGIKRALETAIEADVILYVIDGNALIFDEKAIVDARSQISELTNSFKEKVKPRLLHLVINKIDLNDKLRHKDTANDDILASSNEGHGFIKTSLTRVSCETGENLDHFLSQLTENLDTLTYPRGHEFNMPTTEDSLPNLNYVNERHLSLLKSAQRHLDQASLLTLYTIDEMAQHVRESVDYLSRIVGSVTNDQVIDVIFRDFCIGK